MKKKLFLGLLAVCFVASGCTAALQNAWDGKTDDEKARIIVSGLQKTLSQKFDEAKAFVTANPQYQDIWKKDIVPAFDRCNTTLGKLAKLAQAGTLDPATVYSTYKPEFDALVLYLAKLGMKGGK